MNRILGFGGRSRRDLIFAGVLIYTLFSFVGCAKAPLQPVNIDSDDVCFYCKSAIIDVQYAAELITRDGFVRKFDDFSCLMSNAKKIGRNRIAAFYAMDVSTKTWLPAEEAQFVRSERVATPQKSGIVAFKDVSLAENLAARSSGQLIKLDELLK